MGSPGGLTWGGCPERSGVGPRCSTAGHVPTPARGLSPPFQGRRAAAGPRRLDMSISRHRPVSHVGHKACQCLGVLLEAALAFCKARPHLVSTQTSPDEHTAPSLQLSEEEDGSAWEHTLSICLW